LSRLFIKKIKMLEKKLRKIIRENIQTIIKSQNIIIEKNNPIQVATKQYLSGQINESEYHNFMDAELLSEGIFDTINTKISFMLYSLVVEIGNNAKKYMSKIFSSVMWIIDKIKKFKEKYPVLFKIIVIVCITLILLCISSIAQAQEMGGQSVILNPEELKQAKALQSFMDKNHVFIQNPPSNLDQANIKASGMPLTDGSGLRFIKQWLEDVCVDGKFDGELMKDKSFLQRVNKVGINMMSDLTQEHAKEIKNQAVSDKFVDIGNKLSSLFKKQ